jgi:hypothetical protein
MAFANGSRDVDVLLRVKNSIEKIRDGDKVIEALRDISRRIGKK